jgi:hypothetical protein
VSRVFLKKNIFLYFLITAFYFGEAFSKIKYSSNTSVMKIGGTSTLKTSNPTSVTKGKIEVATTAQVKGSLVTVNGILGQGDKGAIITVNGSYDPSVGPFGTIYLQGNNSIVASSPGDVRSNIIISGKGNLIKGSMGFTGNISLLDLNSQVTLALSSPLNRTILTPNGGLIDLGQDLKLADNVQLPSTVSFNGYQLSLGGKTPKFKGNTTFIKGADLVLNGKAELDGGTWIFIDESVLNGNGNLLDLKNGGTLSLSSGTTLQMTNLILRNIDHESLIFTDHTSGIELASATLEVVNSVTTTIGVVSVVGASSIIVKDGSWTVTEDAKIAVDGVSVLVDKTANQYDDVLFMNPILINKGAIQYLYMDPTLYLFAGVLTSTFLTITSSFIVDQTKTMIFGATTTVDAQGGTFIFTSPDRPQIILLPHTNVTFQNVTLQNITEKTFYIDSTSTLIFGEGTYLKLSSDITFSQGLVVFNNPGKSIFIEGDYLNSIILSPALGHVGPLFDIKTTSLVLSNIILLGPENIHYERGIDEDGNVITGVVVLGGETLVDIDKDLDLYFLIEKFKNYIRLKRNDLRLSGGISFKDTGENELGMTFLQTSNNNVFPRVYFADNYLYVGSTFGRGSLTFDNFGFEIFNQGGNSFLLDLGGVLHGQNISVNNFPIKLLSNDVVIDSSIALISDQFNAIETAFVRDPVYLRDSTSLFEDVDQMGVPALRVPSLKPAEKKGTSKATGAKKGILKPTNPTTYVNSIQLSDAQGEIIVKNTEITKFGVSSVATLNITLQDGGILNQREDVVTLKQGDNINVVGIGNKIIVNDIFILNGDLLFEQNADLTFVFENNGQLLIGAGFGLESGTNLVFSGEGTIVLADEVTITLKQGANNNAAKNSTIQFADGALCLLDQDAFAYIDGVGSVQCYNMGGFLINKNAMLGIGKSLTDKIKVEVDQGQIVVGGTSSPDDFALLSFAYGTYAIDVRLGGVIAILENGEIACNMRQDERVDGIFKSFSLQFGSFFYLYPGSRFTLADNTLAKSTNNSKNKQPEPVSINTMSGYFRGTGLIRYFGKTSKTDPLFEAQLGTVDTSLYFSETAFEMQKWAYRLAQQSSLLQQSLLFFDPDGVKTLLTKKGVFVPLGNDDEIVYENSATDDVNIINRINQDSHLIKADGSRK